MNDMSLLMYEVDSQPNQLRNPGFELEFPIYDTEGDDWFATSSSPDTAIVQRQDIVKAFGDWAVRLKTTPINDLQSCAIYQRLVLDNITPQETRTLSVLVLGESAAQTQTINCNIKIQYLAPDNSWVDLSSIDKPIRGLSKDFWNIAYITFRLPAVIPSSIVRITIGFILGGIAGTAGDYYLDNAKLEPGKRPTRFDATVPKVQSLFPSVPPLGFNSIQPEAPALDFRSTGATNFSAAKHNRDVAEGGNNAPSPDSSCLKEWEEFMRVEQQERMKLKEKRVNNELPQKWETSDDLEHLKAKREQLCECIKNTKEDGRKIPYYRWALMQLSARRRELEMRYQNDHDGRAWNINDADIKDQIVDRHTEMLRLLESLT